MSSPSRGHKELFTHPLFPPLPVYGPPTILRRLQHFAFRVSSGVLSLCFLLVIVAGTVVKSVPPVLSALLARACGRDPDASRPFYGVERERARRRGEDARVWKVRRRDSQGAGDEDVREKGLRNRLMAGGKDGLVCDVGYYARRVGLEVGEFEVETEDGFLIALQHVYDPDDPPLHPGGKGRRRKYPVLLMHGLLQSSGAFCVNDEDSLAFYLCKSGYDVWLGNNRCGFKPKHRVLDCSDPRMWAWNIRQMGIIDLPALIDHVLSTTGFAKLGLICHSQGTTQTFVALAKQQRPDIGSKISVFCALAPAAYAGPLLDKSYLKFMKTISPCMFRMVFGIHAFIPFMMLMHDNLPAKLYGTLGYRVFWFLFGWSDRRWDKGLRTRFFQFSPVFVSAEAMRWWLGSECFARHRCILPTEEADGESEKGEPLDTDGGAWYDDRCPPMALWVAGSDSLVDGRRLIKRFRGGWEPNVRIVHEKVIEEYEHLDVIWAVDAPEKVFEEVVDVLWKCVEGVVRKGVVVPEGVGRSGVL